MKKETNSTLELPSLKMAAPAFPRRAWTAVLLCFVWLSLCAGDTFGAAIKIMPLGDSLTSGLIVPGGYRSKLYANLVNAGYCIVFAGTAEDDPTAALIAAGQTHHEGHGGVLIQQISDNLADNGNYLGADPDVILLLIGTNDYGADEDTPNATNRLDNLIGIITTNRPNARVIVASLTLRTDNATIWNKIQTEYNPFVPTIVSNHVALGEKVSFVDLAPPVLVASDFVDGLHPNQNGYNKLADAWFNAIQTVLSPDTNAPTILQARDGAGLTNVIVSFDKPLSNASAQSSHFSLNGGVTVLNAVLNTNNYRDIQLHTTPLTFGTTYTVTVNDVTDRTTNHTSIAPNSTAMFTAGNTASGAGANVAEAANYTLVYSLDVPNSANFNAHGVSYSVDQHTSIGGPFSRIAYYLELQSPGGPLHYMYVSMDAFTTEITKLGVPNTSTRAFFQRDVANMNVYSTLPGIVTGSGLTGGNIEFWPSSYSETNEAVVPNASNSLFDWGDGGASTNAGHGSMQIANHDASQILFAYNGWGTGTNGDLGVGNQAAISGPPDWTFAGNTPTYTHKRLQVLVFQPLAAVVHLDFNENTGTTTENRGQAGGTFTLTTPFPEWTTNIPPDAGGASALDFGFNSGNHGVDGASPIPELGGLTEFTITGWLNNKNHIQGRGGNRIVSWLGANSGGVEVFWKGDGSLIASIDEVAGSSAPRSSSGKIPSEALGDPSNWRFFAITYKYTNAQVKFYFGSGIDDATFDVARNYEGRGAVEPPTARLTVGNLNPERRIPPHDRMFRGLIDDVSVFTRALSPVEIVQVQRGAISPLPTLTVTSTNPANGVTIAVSPPDNFGLDDGATTFLRTYTNDTLVTLVAPSTAGTNFFKRWKRDGADYDTNLTTAVTMDVSHTMQAVYVPPPGPRMLTVSSVNPTNEVLIIISPADTNGLTNGLTLFTRVYSNDTVVTLSAPATVGTNEFQKWQLDGVDYSPSLTTTVTMEEAHAITAVFAPPPPTRTLSLMSTNPVSAVPITVTPIDNSGFGSGSTTFTRNYSNGVVVTLTAPATAGQNSFNNWQRNGTNFSSSATVNITMDADITMMAVYQPAPFVTLTVKSEKPTNGVMITVSPSDTNGLSSGSTVFSRIYSNGTLVTLTAPLTAGTNKFQKWQRDGANYSSHLTTTVPVDGNHTLTAIYGGTFTPIVYLPFNENGGTTTTNRGTAGGLYTLTSTKPEWITTAPVPVGGPSSLDFGFGSGMFAVDSPAALSALGGLSNFTICGWLNNRSVVQSGPGNVIVTWLNESNEGAELVYRGNGSLNLAVNPTPDNPSPGSSIGKVTEDLGAGSLNWVFFAVTYDSVAGLSEFYFGGQTNDATLDVTRQYSGGATPTNTARLSVGNLNPERRTVQNRIFRGLIDQLQIFGGLLSLNEIIIVQRETTVAPLLLSQSKCPGANVMFETSASGGGPFTYQWTKAGTVIPDATNNSYSIASMGAADAATYCVQVHGFYNSVTNCAGLAINVPITATGPSALVNCPGTTAIFKTVPTGTGPFSYVWRKDGSIISSATNSSYTIAAVSATDVGTYCVEVTGNCNSVTNCATLTVLTNTAATSLTSLTICPGTAATFSTTTSGTGPYSYQWTKNGAAVSGATNSSYSIPSATGTDTGTYCVEVTGACNTVTNCATLTVNGPTTATGPSSLTNCPGTSATFTTAASGTGPFSYRWKRNGIVISGATNSTYTIPSVNAADAASYCVEVTGLCNSVTNCATLVVNQITASTGLTSLTNCPGTSAAFSTVASGTGPVAYRWTKNGAPIAAATSSSFSISSVNASDAATYCVEVTGVCNTMTNCATLTVNENVVAAGPNSLTNCPGTSATFTTIASGTGPLSYRWTRNGNAIAGATNSSYTIASVSAADAATYCVEVKGLCNNVTNCATLTVHVPLAATTPGSLTNCPATPATFTTTVSGTGDITYQWKKNGQPISSATNSSSYTIASVSAADAGTYCVEVTGPCNSATNCAALTVLNSTTATTPVSLAICPGNNATFTTMAAGTGPFSYRWRKNGAPIANATDNSYSIFSVGAGDAGTYCVEVTGFCNTVTNCPTLTVLTNTTATALTSLTNCPGIAATFITMPSGSGPFSYRWTKDGSGIAGATNNFYTISAVSALDAAAYCVEVTGSCTKVTNCARLTVLTNTAATDLTSLTNCPGTIATFTTTASGTGPFSYRWTKDGAAISGATNNSYTISSATAVDAGTYCVEVSGTCNTVTNCATLTVRVPLSASGPFSLINCPDTTATFATVPFGTGPFTYQWKKNGTPISNATNSFLSITAVTAADAGTYCVEVSGPCNSVTNCATLTVLNKTTATGPGPQINCPGATATFVTTPSGSGPFSFKWRRDGVLISGATSSIYSISSVTEADAATYCVEVTGVCNSVTNCTTLTVLESTTATGPSSLTNCPGTSATFTTIASGTGGFNYQWRRNGVVISGATASSYSIPSVSVADVGTYTVEVSGVCNSVTNSATLTVLTNTSVTSLSALTNCPGTFASFTTVASGTGPFSYRWTKNGTVVSGATGNSYSIAAANGGDAGIYCVEVAGVCNTVTNCAVLTVLTNTSVTELTSLAKCPGTTATFSTIASGTGPFSYHWQKNGTPISGATNTSYSISAVTDTDAGTYCVEVAGHCNSVTKCATLMVLTNLTASGPSSLTNCVGTGATFTTLAAGTGPFNYQWVKNGSSISGATNNSFAISSVTTGDAGIYCVEITGNCNSVTNCATLTVHELTVATGLTPLTNCPGTSAAFSTTASGTGPHIYRWTKNGATIDGATNNSYSIPSVTAADAGTYCAEVTGSCNSVSNCVTLIVNVPTTASPLDAIFNCPGETAVFATVASGTGPFRYQWRKNGGLILNATNDSYSIPAVVSADAGTYCVEVTGVCNSVTNCATLTVLVPTTASGPSSMIRCPGTMTTFTTVPAGSGPFSYIWRKNGALISGATSSSYTIPSVTAADAGSYCVEVNGVCNSVTNCANLSVLVSVTATGPTSQTNCPGTEATFTTVAGGTGPLTYQWRKNGSSIPNATNGTYSIASVSAADAALYCVVVNGACGSVSNCATLTVQVPLTATTPASLTNCPNTEALFTTLASGSGPFAYQWTKNNTPIPGATNATYAIASVSATDAAIYCAEVTGPCNRVTNCATLTVLANTTATTLTSLTLCPGANAAFASTASGTGPFNYRWTRNGTAIPNATNDNYSISAVMAADAGEYCVEVTGYCNIVTNCATLVVNEPTVPAGSTSLNSCPGTTATFMASPSGSGPFSFQWTRNGTPISNATNTSYVIGSVTAADASTYCVEITGPCNSVTNCTVLTVLTNTAATSLSSLLNCPGTPATFATTASGTGPFTYRWTKNGSPISDATNSSYTISSVSEADTGTYCVKVTGACQTVTNCATLQILSRTAVAGPNSLVACLGKTATLTTITSGTGPFSYQWRKNGVVISDATNSNYSIPSVTETDAGTYCVETTGLCNSVTNCATLIVAVPTTATSPNSLTNCPGAAATFNTIASGSGPFSYRWTKGSSPIAGATNESYIIPSVSAGDAGTYCVEVTGVCNTVTNCATLTVLNGTTAATLASLTNCPGTTASFATVPNGTAPFSYRWTKNGSPIPNATNSSHSIAAVDFGDAGIYCVEVTGHCNTVTNCATLIVHEPIILTGPNARTNCAGTTATFTTTASGYGPFSYQWIRNGTPITDATNSSYAIASVSTLDVGSYCVEVTGPCSSVTNCATLTVRETTMATVPNSLTRCPGTGASFSTLASGTGPFSYRWTKNGSPILDATNSSFSIAAVSAAAAGAYCVEVTGTCNTVTNCATLTVNENVVVNGPGSLTNCPGTAATFTTVASGTGPLTYRWRKGGTPIANATNSSYTIPAVSVADVGSYCVEVTGLCSSVTNCATLTISGPTSATTLSSLTNCANSSATFSTVAAGTGPFTYRWTKNSTAIPNATNNSYTIVAVSPADAATYCVEVTGACNTVTNCATLTVLASTTATELSSLTNCPGSSATFTTTASGTGPFRYRWTKNGSPIPNATNSSYSIAAVVATNAATYCVEVTGACNSVTNCTTLSVRTLVIVTGPTSLTNCTGSSATFVGTASGSGPLSFRWRKNGTVIGDATNSSYTIPSISLGDAGTYCLEVTGPCNSVTNCATLTVNETLTATGPSSVTNCPGTTGTFTTVASGTGPFSYRWTKNGTLLPGTTNSSYTIASVSVADVATYCVTVTSACNSVTNCASLAVNEPATATSLTSLTNCPGTTATFMTMASGTGPFGYRWTKSGTLIPGATNSSYTIASVTVADVATYCVEVTGRCNTVTNCASLVVNETVTAAGPTSLTNCPGTTATFTTTPSGAGPFNYRWRKDGALIAGATSSSYMIAFVSSTDVGTYSVEVTGVCNSVTNCATLAVNTANTATGLTSQTNCPGTSASFATTTSGTGPIIYRWTKNGALITGATNGSYTIAPVSGADTATYCVIVTGACNNVTNCATLTVKSSTSATSLPNMTKVVGQSATFSTAPSGTGPFTFMWFRDGAMISGASTSSLTLANLTLADSGQYCVKVTGSCNSVTNCATLTVQPITYTITTTASPGVGGATSGGGTFTNGATVTAIATPNPNYVFVNWTESGAEVSISQNYTFTVTTDRALVANFASTIPIPIVHLAFNENTETNTLNTGTAGGTWGLTVPVPSWVSNVPTNVGGACAVDFGASAADYAVDSAGPVNELAGLTKFTITGWVNNEDGAQGSGGNRIVTWLGLDNKGVELVYKGDGSLMLSVNEEPTTARSSAGKIPADLSASPENWRFFAATYDSVAEEVKFYFGSNTDDATFDKMMTYSDRGPVGPATGRLTVGHSNPERRPGKLDRMFRGIVDDVQIFGSVLSSNQVIAVQRGLMDNTPSSISVTNDAGEIRLRVTGTAGQTYRVLASPTVAPATWTAISTNVMGSSGFFEIIDSQAGNFPTRFYRAVSP